MRSFFLHALDELAAAPPGRIVLVTVPAPLVEVDRLLAGLSRRAILLWNDPSAESCGRAYSFVGWGEAARIEGLGEDRFEQIRLGAAALFAQMIERRHPALAEGPSPRLFGGIAFKPEATRPAPWTEFGDGSFTLPRWLYATSGEGASLCLAYRTGERVDRAEIEAVVECIEGHARTYAPHSTDTALWTSRGNERGAPWRSAGGELVSPSLSARLERTSVAEWTRMIEDALARIRARELEKVVPMTLCHVSSASTLDVASVLARVYASYPECVRFAFQRGDAIFAGASPERLVSLRGLDVATDALAGSRARARTAAEDEITVRDLLESDKDRREHLLVAWAIERVLRPLSRSIRVPEAPVVRSLRNVHHLWTPIVATLFCPMHVLDLVRSLHPTPAVCGTPKSAAIEWIAEHEAVTRGWYAGAVGWFNAAGDGSFSVAIRSGLLQHNEAWLYAGAGIVEGSDPEAEYAETRVKQTPMLAALGLWP